MSSKSLNKVQLPFLHDVHMKVILRERELGSRKTEPVKVRSGSSFHSSILSSCFPFP